jgi:uncharacterized sulfatase
MQDVDLLSEWEMHSRSQDSTPYDMGHDGSKYDFEAVFAAADLATRSQAAGPAQVVELLNSSDSGVRYWGVIGVLTHGKPGVDAAHEQLVVALSDDSPIVRVMAAEALGKFGNDDDVAKSLKVLLDAVEPKQDAFLSVAAWNALDHLGARAKPVATAIRDVPPEPDRMPKRYGGYGPTLKRHVLSELN